MDSFELNKIIGAVLGTLLFIMGVGFLAEGIYHPIEDRGPGYTLPEPEPAEGAVDEPEVVVASIGTLLASANPEDGMGAAAKCRSCHNFAEGGPNGQGPNLYGVVGRAIASHEGFSYSDAMVAHAQEVPNWSYEELNLFLIAPKDHVKGTKMNFNGVKDDAERADIIAYLSTLSSAPVPFPPAEAAPAEAPAVEGAAPAAETAPAASDAQAVESPDTTAPESAVEGTATGSDTPAGADAPATTP